MDAIRTACVSIEEDRSGRILPRIQQNRSKLEETSCELLRGVQAGPLAVIQAVPPAEDFQAEDCQADQARDRQAGPAEDLQAGPAAI
ncbi:hypothetical protein F511_17812 [Dorcoceras hygrometricum]|uniref:Uncharacterized protein n=1 Tax=Dorcoceras hygrometricum TaxID=472368 RepID=A0A2Z7CVP5_9LAMI|nr:hypothetical protein F511_17812 [Dorcoceras hygrometricum]